MTISKKPLLPRTLTMGEGWYNFPIDLSPRVWYAIWERLWDGRNYKLLVANDL